jgi:hypothetical protein
MATTERHNNQDKKGVCTQQPKAMVGRRRVIGATKHSSKEITFKTSLENFIKGSAAQVGSHGICSGQSRIAAVFPKVLEFLL